jgi:hypothetical protein
MTTVPAGSCSSTAPATVTHTWSMLPAVLRIRIRMFFGLLDPDPDTLVRGTDPDPVPSITKQK